MENGTTTLIVLKELAGNPPPHLNAIQELLAPHVGLLTTLWISVWITTAAVLLVQPWHAYKEHKNNQSN